MIVSCAVHIGGKRYLTPDAIESTSSAAKAVVRIAWIGIRKPDGFERVARGFDL